MTDEKLIEEAAKAIHDVAMREYPGMPADIYGWDVQKDRDRDVYLLEARAAFAVFEKAHGPTGDERELNIKKLANLLLESVAAQGMRIVPASPEPQGREAKIHGEFVTMRVDEWRRITDELARLRTMEGQMDQPVF